MKSWLETHLPLFLGIVSLLLAVVILGWAVAGLHAYATQNRCHTPASFSLPTLHTQGITQRWAV